MTMTKQIPQPFIDDVIARTDIVELIQTRVTIKKKGHHYLGLCPFHNEKTPSFNVNPQKQFYYCFGCGAHGNAISFLMNYDHLPFVEAITELCNPLGLEIPTSDAASTSNHKNDYELLTKATTFYQQQLKQSPAAIHYLKTRGLTGHIAKHFQVGFAPDEWDSLIRFFQPNADLLTQLEINGLLIKKDSGSCYDRFRHRIIFPIHDTRGRVIAFGGRTLGDDLPKYINSPETPLFQKSHELYGLYEVLQHHHQPSSIIMVEGYMDVIALHQYGICNTVATLGTATNPKHLQKLFRYTSEVIFCFDGDKAGQQAAWKAVLMSLALMRDGIQLRFMFLPQKDDPDSLIRRVGYEGFQQRLQNAKPLSSVFFELLQTEISLDTPDSKALFAKKAAQHLNQMPKGIFRELMFEQLAKQLQVYVSDLQPLQTTPQPKTTPKRMSLLNTAQQAIALLLQEPKLALQNPSLNRLEKINLAQIPLMVQLIQLLQTNPKLSVGELIAHFPDEKDQQEIAYLASRRLPFSVTAILSEFNGAMEQLYQQNLNQEVETLIKKSNPPPLKNEEKKRIPHLLTQLTKIPI